MARIEISMEEYKTLKEENTKLYEEVTELRNNNNVLNEKIEQVTEYLEDLAETGFFERVFHWKPLEVGIRNFITLYKK